MWLNPLPGPYPKAQMTFYLIQLFSSDLDSQIQKNSSPNLESPSCRKMSYHTHFQGSVARGQEADISQITLWIHALEKVDLKLKLNHTERSTSRASWGQRKAGRSQSSGTQSGVLNCLGRTFCCPGIFSTQQNQKSALVPCSLHCILLLWDPHVMYLWGERAWSHHPEKKILRQRQAKLDSNKLHFQAHFLLSIVFHISTTK